MTAETRVGSTFGCWGDNVVYGYILIRILQTKWVERWEGGCGPACHYSVSTEDSGEAAQSARISSIVTKKGGLCCCLAYLVHSSRERGAQSVTGVLDYEAVFSHIKGRRRLGSGLKIMDAGQRGTYPRGGTRVSFAVAGNRH